MWSPKLILYEEYKVSKIIIIFFFYKYFNLQYNIDIFVLIDINIDILSLLQGRVKWKSSKLKYFYPVIYLTQKVHNDFIFLCSLHCLSYKCSSLSEVHEYLYKKIIFPERAATRAPGRGESVTKLMPFMNFLVHSYTCCSDRHASPYWMFIRRWNLMGFTPSLLKKRMTYAVLLWCMLQAGRHFYTTTAPSCCIPASYFHLSATLQTMTITVVILNTIDLSFEFLSHF